ncbi:RagB/SusD family nutrient uptake outer membrane protein [Allomuricauda sp. SCSIO 65647]|uniref:RagB/SusD family nutrient uptake outer membrane protein n=1 Tax=Allomuricauda sp. SCSIO 65647 TaxID=2908843 RepID=UPI001F34D572|nr:RagB/SusD family nutrient uptake outer membrane protein [Muricauda sp. SCSIO 65647]UJH67823.1 RagB/SusD family nutrient uptake outer membrane protein [Muricauda sp. SCSIO 65647]
MKSIRTYLMLTMMVLMVSCNEDFIELAPISQGNVENFFQTPEDFEAAIIGAYANLQSPDQYGSNDTRFGGSFYTMMEVRADDVANGDVSGVGFQVLEVDTFVDNTLSGIIEGAWNSTFKSIFDANIIITRIENAEFDGDLKNQYIGEARFLRALAYFNAIRLWGDVPLILEEITPQEAAELTRNTVADIYIEIENDLEFAVQNLPATFSGQEGRATSNAARALLGKVYLTQQKWAEASTVLNAIVQSGDFTLLENVGDVFAIDNELNDEIIFSIRFSNLDDVGHQGFGQPDYSALLPFYDAADARLPLLDPVMNANGTYPAKQAEDGDPPLGRDFPLMRYADVVLMLAEALNEVGYEADATAFDLLNSIRSRAGINVLSSTDLPDQQSFRDAVYLERRLELPLELQRWFDLLRQNRAIEALAEVGVTAQTYQLLYPIPLNEINVYNDESQFPQNPGY